MVCACADTTLDRIHTQCPSFPLKSSINFGDFREIPWNTNKIYRLYIMNRTKRSPQTHKYRKQEPNFIHVPNPSDTHKNISLYNVKSAFNRIVHSTFPLMLLCSKIYWCSFTLQMLSLSLSLVRLVSRLFACLLILSSLPVLLCNLKVSQRYLVFMWVSHLCARVCVCWSTMD